MSDTAASLTATASQQGTAVIIGATGGVGRALFDYLQQQPQYAQVIGFARREFIPLDLLDEASIAAGARYLADQAGEVSLIIDATGVLEGGEVTVEKSWRQLDAASMAYSFAINAIGPALLMKHFLPVLPRDRRCVFATLSARVGSIGDNHLGGWYSYRASKASLNQIVRTAAIELKRARPQAICVALHPGTVDTGLSRDFAKKGLEVQTPALAAERIVQCLSRLNAADTGGFFDQMGRTIEW